MNAVVGGLDQNVETLARFRTQASSVGADLVLTPELPLTGYPPEDLLLKEGFVEAAAAALDELGRARNLAPVLVGTVVGEQAPGVVLSPSKDARDVASGLVRERPFDHVGNALVALGAGGVVATATKRLLSNYDVFDEVRYFHPGVGAHTIDNCRGVATSARSCCANAPSRPTARSPTSTWWAARTSSSSTARAWWSTSGVGWSRARRPSGRSSSWPTWRRARPTPAWSWRRTTRATSAPPRRTS